jgi:hypothetical protein
MNYGRNEMDYLTIDLDDNGALQWNTLDVAGHGAVPFIYMAPRLVGIGIGLPDGGVVPHTANDMIP